MSQKRVIVFAILIKVLIVLTSPARLGAYPFVPDKTPVPTAESQAVATIIPGGSFDLPRVNDHLDHTQVVPSNMTENFEDNWPAAGWVLVDQSSDDGGEFLWGKRNCHPHTGIFSGWSVGGGQQGSDLNCNGEYPNNTNTWIVYGPFSLSNATAASLTFYYWGDVEGAPNCQFDAFRVGSSINGTNFGGGFIICGNLSAGDDGNGYHRETLDLSNHLGQPQVWIAFNLVTDGTVTKNGVFVDDITLEVTTNGNIPSTPTLNNISNSDQNGDYLVSWNGVSDATIYELEQQQNGGSWSNVYTGPNTVYSVTGNGNGDWCYRVRAGNANGFSSWSAIQCTVVNDGGATVPVLYEIFNPEQDGDYLVLWQAVPDATAFELQEQLNGGSWSTIYNGPGGLYQATGRSDGQWCYRVRASYTSGISGWSTTRCTTVDTTSVLPAPILNEISNPEQDGNYNLLWQLVPGATAFELQERLNGGSWNTIYNGPNSLYEVTGRSTGEWCYQVRARNAAGIYSDWSTTRCVTVDTPPSSSELAYIPVVVGSPSDQLRRGERP